MPNRGAQIDRFRSREEQQPAASGQRDEGRSGWQRFGDAVLGGTGVGGAASLFRDGIDSPGARAILAGTGVGNIVNLASDLGQRAAGWGGGGGDAAGGFDTGEPYRGSDAAGATPSFREAISGTGLDRTGQTQPGPVRGSGDPFADFEAAIGQYEQAMGQLDSAYDAELQRLQGLYELSETPQEQAMLQAELADIEGQRRAGQQIVESVYGAAIDDAGARADAMREQAAVEGRTVADLYTDAAERTAGELAEISDRYAGTGLGVEAAADRGGAADHVGAMHAAAPREQAYAERSGQIAAEDVDWLADTMGAERGAQAGDLERLAMGISHEAQQAHQQRVQDRIAQERMAFAQQAGQLGQSRLQHQAQAAQALPGMQLELDQARHAASQQQDPQQQMLAEAELEWELQRAAQQAGVGEDAMIPPDFPSQQVFAAQLAQQGQVATVVNLVRQGHLPSEVLDGIPPELLEGAG